LSFKVFNFLNTKAQPLRESYISAGRAGLGGSLGNNREPCPLTPREWLARHCRQWCRAAAGPWRLRATGNRELEPGDSDLQTPGSERRRFSVPPPPGPTPWHRFRRSATVTACHSWTPSQKRPSATSRPGPPAGLGLSGRAAGPSESSGRPDNSDSAVIYIKKVFF
jgi:hypothetical protein